MSWFMCFRHLFQSPIAEISALSIPTSASYIQIVCALSLFIDYHQQSEECTSFCQLGHSSDKAKIHEVGRVCAFVTTP